MYVEPGDVIIANFVPEGFMLFVVSVEHRNDLIYVTFLLTRTGEVITSSFTSESKIKYFYRKI